MSTDSPSTLDEWRKIAEIAGEHAPHESPQHYEVATALRWEPTWTPELEAQREEIRRILAGEA